MWRSDFLANHSVGVGVGWEITAFETDFLEETPNLARKAAHIINKSFVKRKWHGHFYTYSGKHWDGNTSILCCVGIKRILFPRGWSFFPSQWRHWQTASNPSTYPVSLACNWEFRHQCSPTVSSGDPQVFTLQTLVCSLPFTHAHKNTDKLTQTLISTHLRVTSSFGYTRLSMNPIPSSLIDLSNSDTWTWTLLLHLRKQHFPALPGDTAASPHSIWSLQADSGKLRSPSLRNIAISFHSALVLEQFSHAIHTVNYSLWVSIIVSQ